MNIIDIHPHVISNDEERYPLSPLYGKRSDWSKERPKTVETLIAAMDEAGVAKAAVVHSSTTYGFDNSYVLDSCSRYRDRLVPVCSVDMLADDAPKSIKALAGKGLAGLRIFTGGTTKEIDPSELDDPKSFKAWDALAELGLSMCIQTQKIGLPMVRMLAEKYPGVSIILDHLSRPDITDGPPYANAASLFELAELPNICLKITPRTFIDVRQEKAGPETFFPKLVGAFGAQRLAWGSNFPASPGTLGEILATAQQGLACVSEEDRAWIFGKTAQKLYPALA
jgi:Predicted metal-dependent hydrolase of the TIM-barrel fold